ncbi:MAG TPA: alpha/beta hydrolase [Burkholderiales bacterium]|nr:alpha/beta hydrolase [Burkholderiales bacterium]
MNAMQQQLVRANGVRFNVWTAGEGPPLLLLHGYPETALMWRKIVPQLLPNYRVVCPDLRGYGDSDKPRDGYDKRTMALDMKLLMEGLGFKRYAVVGHDRGARVGHRFALDHPDAVERLCVIDIVPTHTMFRSTNKELAVSYWHWFFFQVPDLPEVLIASQPEAFLRFVFRALGIVPGAIDEPVMQEYLRAFKLPGTQRATLEDYRAAATIDYQQDEQDLGRKVTCPVLALWGERGRMHPLFDVLATWREKAQRVEGKALPSGHFIPEEAPEPLLAELLPFLQRKF